MLKRAVVFVALCATLTSCTFRRPPHYPVQPPKDPVVGGDVNLPPGDPREPCGVSPRPDDCLGAGQDPADAREVADRIAVLREARSSSAGRFGATSGTCQRPRGAAASVRGCPVRSHVLRADLEDRAGRQAD